MQTGAITGYIDVAQMTLYAFWLFFAGLIWYLRREDKREGYPLVSDRSALVRVQGFPPIPAPKRFLLPQGGLQIPHRAERTALAISPTAPFPGAPFQPTGNPMVDGVGPAAFALRADEPDLAFEDQRPKIVPLRVATEFFLATEDPNPVGMPVYGADRALAGTVVDAWIDRSETILRYLEVELSGGRRVLLPMNFLDLNPRRRTIAVSALLAAQFADIPALAHPDVVTLLEEDRILGFFGGGAMYATPRRAEPLL